MKYIGNFKPIYFWAQSKDNFSRDDFCEFNVEKGLMVIESLPDVQTKVKEISTVVDNALSHKNIFIENLHRVLSKECQNVKYYSYNGQILLIFGLNERDVIGRISTITVFLNTQGLKVFEIGKYLDFFYDGLIDFLVRTNEFGKISVVKEGNYLNFIDNDLLNYFLNLIPKPLQKNSSIVTFIMVVLLIDRLSNRFYKEE